jgi:hypothetical protein
MHGRLAKNEKHSHDARGVTKLFFTSTLHKQENIPVSTDSQMAYLLKIFSADDVTEADRELAAQRFRTTLENALGDAALVLPCYAAYRKLFLQYADHPRPWPVSPAELLLADQWEAAELAATQAAFGVNRYLGDADFEIVPMRQS